MMKKMDAFIQIHPSCLVVSSIYFPILASSNPSITPYWVRDELFAKKPSLSSSGIDLKFARFFHFHPHADDRYLA
ncbi:hypothetical protein L6452_12726 [Arctium lappa]|uniref:Uncharacterized protein n=1 Tax=Arctium lappa TaxID=4217 RepID=A0ACB9DRT4_ARCLA|nr:hypothetical protein L6452_12726 [Arctium lappa]